MKLKVLNTETITFRLTLKYTLFIFITLIVLSTTTLFSVHYYLYAQASSQLENINNTIKHEVIENSNLSDSDLKDISQMNENIEINVIKSSNGIFSTNKHYGINVPVEIIGKAQKYKLGENNLFYFNENYQNNSGEKFVIQVIKDMGNELEFVQILFWILLVLNGFAFCISIVLGYLMSKKALNPIEKIVKQAKSITVNDLSQRIKIEGPDDELKRLAETFNELISSIEIGYEKQNRFTLDASHELATPLAVIKGYLDIIGRWGKNDAGILDEAIEAMKKETKNMTALLDTLLFIAKNDNDISRLEKSEFWVNELLIEILRESKLVYPEYSIELYENQSMLIYADRRLIKQMLRAIVDNSVKYSYKGSAIAICSKQSQNTCEISIEDHGIGIDKKDIPHIFDRFFRVDKARTRDIGGSGLGLSIVKWIVDIHNGYIQVESELGVGTMTHVFIPMISKNNI